MCDLCNGVNTGVGAPRGVNSNRLAGEPLEHPLDFRLHRSPRTVGLPLPPGEPAAVVVQRDQNGARHRTGI